MSRQLLSTLAIKINETNDSVANPAQDLFILPMETIDSANFVKLRDKNVRNGSNHKKNIYGCDQTDRKNEIIKGSEERQIRHFFNWRVMLDEEGHLIIIGTSDSGNFVRSQPINKRLTDTNVESIFNNVYHIHGNLVDYWDELPDYIRFKFYNGFPEDWKSVTHIWKLFVTQGSNSNFHWPTLKYMKKEQTQNAFEFKVHFCTLCGQKCNSRQILKGKNDNSIYNGTYLPNSADLPTSNEIQNVYNISNNSLDKENLTKYKNINDNQSSLFLQEKKMNNLKDKQNAIVTNLLNQDVPKEHIYKIIEILNFDKNTLSSKLECNVENSTLVQNNEMIINNYGKSYDVPLLTELSDSTKSNVDESHRTLKIAVKEEQNASTESEEINDMLSQRTDKENAERFESNAYTGKPRIISDMILSNREILVKRFKNQQRREKSFYNLTSRSSRKFIDSSEFTDSDEKNKENMKYHTKRFNKRKNNSFSNNSYSSIEESKQKKYRNKTKMIVHNLEIPEITKRFVDTNQLDAIKEVSKNSTNINTNQIISEPKQNMNENVANDKLEFIPVLNNTSDINENDHQLISDEDIKSDDEIYESTYNNNNNESLPISNGNDIQTESNKDLSLLELKKPKLLSNWRPQVIFDGSLTDGYSLIFEGQLLNDAGHVINRKFKTHPIHERLSSTLIQDINQDIYLLVGDLHNSKDVVPKKLVRYCLHGCPLNINKFCKMWKSYIEGDKNKIVTKQENKITNTLNVATSSRGRKIYPPLNYWTGERVVSKQKEAVYTESNTPKCSKDANTSPEMMDKQEKMYESLSDHESFQISKQKEASDTSKDENFKLPQMIKKGEIRLNKCDLQLNNHQHKVNKNNKKVLRSDKHANNNKQQSSTKKINLRYSYYKNVPKEDDILSDDESF